MSRRSILKLSTVTAAVIMIGLASSASANQPDAANVAPGVTISRIAAHADARPSTRSSAALALTSRRPWLAPVGHRQPQLADVPKSETVSAWEQQQQQFDHELDRKLIICRGC